MYGDSDLIRYCVCRSIKKLHYLLQCDSLRLLLYRGCRIIRCARNIRRSHAVKLARKYDQKFAEHCELIGGDFISGLTAATARSIAASGLNVTVREQTIRSECSQH
jgi:hypothetical protein